MPPLRYKGSRANNPYLYDQSMKKWRASANRAAAASRLIGKGRMRRVGNYGRYNRGFQQELKYFDYTVDKDPLSTNGTVANALTIPQGVDASERIGRKIVVKSLHLRGRYLIDDQQTSTDAATIIVRMIIYVDKQCNGASAGVTDILHNTSWIAFRALDNAGRFQILYDKSYALKKEAALVPSSDNPYTFQMKKIVQWNKRVNVPVLYDGATGAVTEICCNNIGILFICDSSLGNPEFNGTLRVRYQG